MKILKKMLILCSLVMVFTLIFADASFAQTAGSQTTVMSKATSKAIQVFNSVKMIIFVVGGFGLVGIAFQAIFGKVKWTWFAGLAIGLAILAAAGSIVNYATGSSINAGTSGDKVSDTFGTNDTGEGW